MDATDLKQWSNLVKREVDMSKTFKWPDLDGKIEPDVEIKQNLRLFDLLPPSQNEFPTIFDTKQIKKSKSNKNIKLSHDSKTDSKSFHAKLSNKVKKKTTESYALAKFVNKSKKKLKNRPVLSEKTLLKLKELNIVKFQGKKREIPHRKLSSLKKKILKIRKARQNLTETSYKVENCTEPIAEKISETQISLHQLSLTTNEPSRKVIQHSRKFRSYCNNLTSDQLCKLTEQLLSLLVHLQDMKHEKNSEKAKRNKRFICGIHEIQKYLDLNKLQMLIIAPDLETCPGEGGLDDVISKIICKAEECKVPYLFSLGRRKLGYVLKKKIPVSCVGVINLENCGEIHSQLMLELRSQKNLYKKAKIVK